MALVLWTFGSSSIYFIWCQQQGGESRQPSCDGEERRQLEVAYYGGHEIGLHGWFAAGMHHSGLPSSKGIQQT